MYEKWNNELPIENIYLSCLQGRYHFRFKVFVRLELKDFTAEWKIINKQILNGGRLVCPVDLKVLKRTGIYQILVTLHLFWTNLPTTTKYGSNANYC